MTKREPLAARIVGVYRGWRALAKVEGEQIPLVDFDVAPIGRIAILNNLEEVYGNIYSLREEIDPSTEQDGEFIAGQLEASLAFIKAKQGMYIPLSEYIQKTMAVEIEKFTDEEIEEKKTQISNLLEQNGLEYSPNGLEAHNAASLITDPKVVEKKALDSTSWAKETLSKDVEYSSLNEDVRFIHNDEHSGYSGQDEDGRFFVEINKNSPTTKEYLDGLTIHEYTHLIQAAIRRTKIDQGTASVATGVTTIHGPWNIQAEGLAYMSEKIHMPDMSWRHEVELLRSELRTIVYHNAHIMVNHLVHSQGVDSEEAIRSTVDYVVENLPVEPLKRIFWSVRSRLQEPSIRANFASHGSAIKLFKPLIEVGDKQAQVEAIRFQYEHPRLPSHIQGDLKAT